MSASNSKLDHAFEDEEIFDDSTFLANFDNTSFKQTEPAENNLNDHNTSALNVSALCCDEEINGYDKLTGQTWIYPTNYSVRDYQFNIIQAALVKNTLVSLPTGLGKTFIAAVIMYNFYRWYPLGKIVFTAPTRPLVAQQIEACYNIVAIPPNDTIEMTGHMQVTTRKTHWQSKRVFFATPQVIYNDLKSGICPADKIRCLVIDEAHRARGNYAYCQIVGMLDDLGTKTYRLLALSATPGSKVEDVINVVKSLHIAHLELRTENCIDVAPYSHARKINTVVIPLGPELTQLRQQYVEILDYYARRLKQFNILPQNLGNLSKGRVVMLYKEYQNKDRGSRHPQHNYIMKDFTLLIALYHGLELLTKHGSRVFLNFFDEHPEKSWIQSDDRLTALLERLRDDLGVNPMSLDTSILPDGTIPDLPSNLCFGHPKFDRLKNIMVEHFTNAKNKGQDTRAIVFCEYRESVNLVHRLLLQCRPLITPQMFVGQGASGKDGKTMVSQKQQLRVMRAFRDGGCNALVATCVAEEGLDVGSVDLILCFDISTRSPVRLVQRCGRTGRERGGQVFILVTEGREHQTLMDCMRQRDGLNKKIQQSKEVESNLYKLNPRMMPHGFSPRCQKMHITVAKKDAVAKRKPTKKAQGQKDLRSMLAGRASTSCASPKKQKTSGGLRLTDVFPDDHEFDLLPKSDTRRIEPMETEIIVVNSQDTQDLAVPSPAKSKQTKKKQKVPVTKSPAKNYGDIRALFSTGTKSTKNYTKLINELGVNDASVPTKLINLLVDLNLDNGKAVDTCYICQHICNCKLFKTSDENVNKTGIFKMLNEPYLPNVDLIDDLDAETILLCDKSAESDVQDILQSISKNVSPINKSNENYRHYCSANFDLEFDFDALDEIESPEIKDTIKVDNTEPIPDTNFDLGDIDDIFAEGSPEENIIKDLESNNKNDTIENKNVRKEPDEALGFFGLDSIDDIFADSDDSVIHVSPEAPATVATRKNNSENDESKESSPKPSVQSTKDRLPNIEYPLSPSILSGQIARPSSPILCSQTQKLQFSTKTTKSSNSTPNIKKKLVLPDTKDHKVIVLDDDEQKSNVVDTTNKSMFTITQLVEMINKTQNNSVQENQTSKLQESVVDQKIDLTNDEERSTSPILLTQSERNIFTSPILLTQSKRKISTSPILLTQSDKKKTINLSSSKSKSQSKSLIILDSDSDSDDTQLYDIAENLKEVDTSKPKTNNSRPSLFDNINKMQGEADNTPKADSNVNKKEKSSPIGGKRKFDDQDSELMTASPYFNKKQKLDVASENPLTLQQKVLAAISSNKNKQEFGNNQTSFHFTVSQPNFSQKENANPQINEALNKSHEEIKSTIDVLQKFRRENKVLSLRRKFNTIFKKSPKKSPIKYNKSDDEFSPKKLIFSQSNRNEDAPKKKLVFKDSDDDFVNEKSSPSSPKQPKKVTQLQTKNHKVRKKKRKHHSLLDMEASLSDSDSGDELTDDSVGSIAEFICDDDDVTHNVDMQALYLKSVRSPVKKNGFKIPEMTKKFKKADIFSQFVQEDAYEMDSFCVDSHIGLTQVNDLSELELAEMVLRKKKRKKQHSPLPEDRDSPVVKRKFKKVKTLDSDSEDSP